jgi:hypothetical protein
MASVPHQFATTDGSLPRGHAMVFGERNAYGAMEELPPGLLSRLLGVKHDVAPQRFLGSRNFVRCRLQIEFRLREPGSNIL